MNDIVVLSQERLQELLVEAAERGARRVLEECGVESGWMDKDGVANMTGYKPAYISELVRRRGLSCHRVGRKMRFRRDEVEAWMARNGGKR